MIPRLYVQAPLDACEFLTINDSQTHYLKVVLRREPGDPVRVFNGKDGEFSATITELKKKSGIVKLGELLRPQDKEPELTLFFAPVKRPALEAIVQKATELGVSRLCPVLTERTVAPKLNIERLQMIAIEAAEQSYRLSTPRVATPVKLKSAIDDLFTDQYIYFCDEAGDDETQEWGGDRGRAPAMLEVLKIIDRKPQKGAILIGPEGGFSPAERAQLRANDNVKSVSLGPRILRADTAAIAALTLWQACLGDWGGTD